MIGDDDFLNDLRNGRPVAFETLVERFEGPLYRFFLCDHGDHHGAQDETAETFAHLVRSLPKMRGNCEQLRAYVFAVARHVQKRHWRQRQKLPAPLAEAQHVGDARSSPLANAIDRERLERVLHAVTRLEQPLRNVLLLRFVECLSLEEVAHALELPLGTVKSHIHRGRAQLRQKFAKEGCES